MANPEDKIIKPNTATSNKKEDDFVVHTMPKEFLNRKSEERKKPLVQAPQPVIAPAPSAIAQAMPVTSPTSKVAKPVAKSKSKLPLVLIAIGIIIITAMSIGAYFVVKGVHQVIEEPPQVDETPGEVVEEPEEPVVRTPVRGQDTDSDGLTDSEEALYGTDFRNPDTDADTFLDGNEVFHSYDPLGFAPRTLLDNGSVLLYESVEDGYSLTYPKTWTVVTTAEGVSFKSSRSTRVTVQEYSQIDFALVERTDNDLVAYRDTEDSVFVFTHDLGEDQLINYQQTFQMIVNSFSVQP